MRTNIVLDEDLVTLAFQFTNATTKQDLIHIALTAFVETHQRKDLRELKGKISFDPTYDYKALR